MASPISYSKKSLLSGHPPTVYLVRHGDTAYNSGHTSPEKFRSHADVPLSAEGRQEARDLADKLSAYKPNEVYSSDLSRASDTAEAIAKATGAEHEIDERLRPWDLGELTGTPVKEGIDTINQYASKTPDKPLPGGESFNQFREDYLDALDDILNEAAQTGNVVVVVTHSRDLQLTKASAAAKGGFSNHNIDLSVFQDYSDETGTGDMIKLQYVNNEWRIMDQEKG